MRKSNIIRNLTTAAIFIALEVAALAMLNNNGALQRMWFSQAAHGFMGTIWGSTQRVKDYFSLRSTNDSLALENHALRVRLAELEKFAEESKANTSMTGLKKSSNFQFLPAHVMKISNNTQHNYMIINKGYADGVSEGDGVITGKGAVGIIDAVSENYSYARSFRNHGMSISARLGKLGSVGPLNWNGKGRNEAILSEIPHHMEFAPGDTVYTSGFSSIFPADIPLGVTSEATIVNGATYDIKVRLFEDFASLKYVTIVGNMDREEINNLEN